MITFSNQTAVNTVPSFEELLGKMMPHFRGFAKYEMKLTDDNFDECVQELTCMAYENYRSLIERGLSDRIFFSPIMKYTMLRIREARSYLGVNTTDVYSKGTQLKGQSELHPIHLMREHNDPKEYLADPKANVARIVVLSWTFSKISYRNRLNKIRKSSTT